MSTPTVQDLRVGTANHGQPVELKASSSPWHLLCNDAHSALDSTYTTALAYLDPVKLISGFDDDGSTAIVGADRFNIIQGTPGSLYIDLILRTHKDDVLANQPWPTAGASTGYLFGFRAFNKVATIPNQIGTARAATVATADADAKFEDADSTNNGIWIPLPDESGSTLLTLANSTSQNFHQLAAGHSANATMKPRRNINFSAPVTCRTKGCTKFAFLLAEVPTWSQTPSATQVLASFWS